MAEHYNPSPEEDASVFKIPRINKAIATLTLLAAAGSLTACAHEKQCEVVGTHTMQSGETVWGSVDADIPAADKKGTDVRERMEWVKQVNPGTNPLGRVQAGETINVPGNCK